MAERYDPDSDPPWEVRVRFHHTTTYPHVVQVIWFDDGAVLVEAFETTAGLHRLCHYDLHWSSGYGTREMLVYPALVTGANWRRGFAMLETSETGETTTVGPLVNEAYQRTHGISGRVVDGDRSLAFTWKIQATPEGLALEIPDANRVTR